MHTKIDLTIPIKTVSEANSSEHWSAKHKRHKAQKTNIALALNSALSQQQVVLPCRIKLTRISPRFLDDDNLVSAFKHIRDYIANILIPGMRMGFADSSTKLSWEYDQVKGSPQAIRIEIAA